MGVRLRWGGAGVLLPETAGGKPVFASAAGSTIGYISGDVSGGEPLRVEGVATG